ncbi:hypothetical protein DYB32_005591 [Aphanomyces invadans]|uniref:Arf-GAP domain-containing protein n=1 Tax=Aphanomyces invadans TaxID=157072 RepID=A0A418AU78_9STRA|nr:hypothetical protein DYB32_005591 [Aphanomyces invadans]
MVPLVDILHKAKESDNNTMAAATYVSHEIRDNFFHAQRSIAANKMCFDCERRSPMWATVSFGTFMCLDCSGYHRRMGVHVSFVRSTDMDEWTEEQLLLMQLGGNSEARKFFKQHGVSDMMNVTAVLSNSITTLTISVDRREAKPTDEFGLDDLAKLVGTAEVPPIANAYTARTVAAPSPVPDVSATAATMPPPAPTTGLLQTRPTVTLGSDSSGPSGAGGSTITSKLSSRVRITHHDLGRFTSLLQKAGATGGAKKATRLGATKVKSNFDDFDNIPFEVRAATDTSHSKQIDDDEALARAMQQAEEEALGRSFSQHATIKAAPFQTPSAPAADSLNKYKNSKSISSDNFFAAEQSSVDPDKIRQFSGSQSISSDMYYGDGRARSASTEGSCPPVLPSSMDR